MTAATAGSAATEGLTEPDLLGCADEPIRLPGAVQPHGVLLGVEPSALTVQVASANTAALFGADAEALLGRRLDELAPSAAAALREALAADTPLWPLAVHLSGHDVDVTASRADGLLLLEWEPREQAGEAGPAWHRRLPLVLQRLQAARTVAELADTLACDVRDLTGFDRVMVYRFGRDWSGEVVAEHRRDDLEPFLGLRFPASDIPAQARALYVAQWLRLIPDAAYTPVPLVPDQWQGRPLDLGLTGLRSVSPVHLEYLANMGVVASMSMSLITGGRLWGLVACHHYAGPHRPSPTDRVTAEFLGRTASLLLATTSEAADADRVLAVAERQAALLADLARSPRDPASALLAGEHSLLDLLPAGGAAARLDGRLHLLGATPPAERVPPLLAALFASGTPVTDALSRMVPDAADLDGTAAGVLAVPLRGGATGDALAWFRPETLRQVDWGGDPRTKEYVEGEHGPRLSPRRSFARWSETVRGTSEPWLEHEVGAARQLAAHLGDVRLNRAEQESRLAATLQRTLLLEQLPVLPGVDLAVRYLPSAADVVGGDWYDVFLLPDGRVSVVLGDVAGHGLGAAAVTAQLRHGLRAYLLHAAGPAAALQRLNELVAFLLPDELATAVVAELDPARGRLTVASAGHLPALLLDGEPRLVEQGRGPALGLLEDAHYEQVDLPLQGSDRVLLYTDGLVERRGEDVSSGLDRLRAVAGPAPRQAEALLDAVLAGLSERGDDDVTVLTLGPSA